MILVLASVLSIHPHQPYPCKVPAARSTTVYHLDGTRERIDIPEGSVRYKPEDEQRLRDIPVC